MENDAFFLSVLFGSLFPFLQLHRPTKIVCINCTYIRVDLYP